MDWQEIFDETIRICGEDPEYDHYAGREKMLAFIFTFLQQLNKNKDAFAAPIRHTNPIILLNSATLRELKARFQGFSDDLLFDATNSGEVQARPVLANYYRQVLWTGFVFILNYWAKDNSSQQERTDVFVEKTVHFMFDMLAPNAIDSGVDLARFLLQLRKSN